MKIVKNLVLFLIQLSMSQIFKCFSKVEHKQCIVELIDTTCVDIKLIKMKLVNKMYEIIKY